MKSLFCKTSELTGRQGCSLLGCGVGLRSEHYNIITHEWPRMDWFEAISENFMDSGGRPLTILEQVRSHYPVALHGVSLSIGSSDPLSSRYLERLKKLVERIDPEIISDHLCWSGVDGENLHDLLPLPFTEEAIRHVVLRVQHVQEYLRRSILLENVSSYVSYSYSTMPEWAFLSEIARRSGCGILLDLNNIFVNAVNHRFDPYVYLRHIPGELIGQFHLAGHTNMGKYLFDTHSAPVIDRVWDLYRQALRYWGAIPTLIEWDEDIPVFSRLAQEAARARAIRAEICEGQTKLQAVSSEPSNEIRAPIEKTSQLSGSRRALGFNLEPPARSSSVLLGAHSVADAPSLRELQQQMKSHIRPEALSSKAEGLSHLLNPQGGSPGIERLAVYADGYLVRMQQALAEVYGAVRFVLGESEFAKLAKEYAVCYPSRDYNLSLAGRNLPGFLSTAPVTKGVPFLSDLARLEWDVAEAFHSVEEPSVDAAAYSMLGSDAWEDISLRFQPSVGVIDSRWPILDIWRARRQPRNEVNIDLVNRPQRVLIYRRDTQVRCVLIDPRQYLLLEALLSGKSLGLACERLSGEAKLDLSLVAGWFSQWAVMGLIAGVSKSA